VDELLIVKEWLSVELDPTLELLVLRKLPFKVKFGESEANEV
jgi:hypothetical protein